MWESGDSKDCSDSNNIETSDSIDGMICKNSGGISEDSSENIDSKGSSGISDIGDTWEKVKRWIKRNNKEQIHFSMAHLMQLALWE